MITFRSALDVDCGRCSPRLVHTCDPDANGPVIDGGCRACVALAATFGVDLGRV